MADTCLLCGCTRDLSQEQRDADLIRELRRALDVAWRARDQLVAKHETPAPARDRADGGTA